MAHKSAGGIIGKLLGGAVAVAEPMVRDKQRAKHDEKMATERARVEALRDEKLRGYRDARAKNSRESSELIASSRVESTEGIAAARITSTELIAKNKLESGSAPRSKAVDTLEYLQDPGKGFGYKPGKALEVFMEMERGNKTEEFVRKLILKNSDSPYSGGDSKLREKIKTLLKLSEDLSGGTEVSSSQYATKEEVGEAMARGEITREEARELIQEMDSSR